MRPFALRGSGHRQAPLPTSFVVSRLVYQSPSRRRRAPLRRYLRRHALRLRRVCPPALPSVRSKSQHQRRRFQHGLTLDHRKIRLVSNSLVPDDELWRERHFADSSAVEIGSQSGDAAIPTRASTSTLLTASACGENHGRERQHPNTRKRKPVRSRPTTHARITSPNL